MSAQVEGVDELGKTLEQLLRDQYPNVEVHVGYTAEYAAAVHERIEMKLQGQPRRAPSKGLYWDPQGKAKAKFLEDPFRDMADDTLRKIAEMTSKGLTFKESMIVAGQAIQRASQQQVPVDFALLKASAYTEAVEV